VRDDDSGFTIAQYRSHSAAWPAMCGIGYLTVHPNTPA
jgi:hypothetical protein